MLKNNKRVTLLLFGIALCLTGLIWERTGTASADTTAKRCGAVTAFTPASAGADERAAWKKLEDDKAMDKDAETELNNAIAAFKKSFA